MRKKRAVLSSLVVGLALWGVLSPVMADNPPPQSPTADPAIYADDYYDSGWVSLAAGTCKEIFHNLGGDPNDYAVELLFLDEAAGGLGLHRRGYGGLDATAQFSGAWWQRLESNTIEVCRGLLDERADKVRVLVFVPIAGSAKWDSGWRDIKAGESKTFAHQLDIPATDLTVGLWFRDRGGRMAIHHRGYGGHVVDVPRLTSGAAWHNLTDKDVQVTVFPDETQIDQVRVIVVEADAPDWDSLDAFGTWQGVGPGTTLNCSHLLNWDPDMLLVRAECQDPGAGGWGIHQLFAGGVRATWIGGQKGFNTQRQGRNMVELYRWQDDVTCPTVRVRVWRRAARVYVPMVMLNGG